jgi:hypothetical protein
VAKRVLGQKNSSAVTAISLRPAEPIPYNRSSGELLLTTKEETRVALTCPSCGNDQNFLVKTLQMHVVHLEDSRVEVSEEGRPAVLEILCDECETALNFDDVEDAVRKELLLTLGAR